MKYFSKNKKWMAYLILLTFLFTSIMPSNLGSMNSVAEAAVTPTEVATVDTAKAGISITMTNIPGNIENHRPFKNGAYTNGGIKQGLVERTLTDGYPRLASNRDSGTNPVTNSKYTSDRSLADCFSGNSNGFVTQSVTGLFLKSEYDNTGYYHYSSFDNAAVLSGGKLHVYTQLMAPRYSSYDPLYSRGNFLPYNNFNQVKNTPEKVRYDEAGGSIDGPKNLYIIDKESDVDFHFGMTVSARFTQPEGGQLLKKGNAAEKENMVFEFNGDDDLWVFIDDVLVLDLGGIHQARAGSINFANGTVKAAGASDTTIKAQFAAAGKATTTGFSGNTFADYTEHEIKIFYMERGEGASDLKMRFNLPTIPANPDITKTVEVNEAFISDREYDFNIEVADNVTEANGVQTPTGVGFYNGKATIINPDGTVKNEITVTNGNVSLKHGEKVSLHVPEDKFVRVTEVKDATDTFVTAHKVDRTSPNASELEGRNDGQAGETSKWHKIVSNRVNGTKVFDQLFYQFFNTVNKADLTITKQLDEGLTDNITEFQFKVYFRNSVGENNLVKQMADWTLYQGELDSSSTGTISANGVISLNAGETAVLKDIPAGTEYFVEEVLGSNSNYEVKNTNLKTVVAENGDVVASGDLAVDTKGIYGTIVDANSSTSADVTVNTVEFINGKYYSISGTKTWVDGNRNHNNASEVILTLTRTANGTTETVEATPEWSSNTYTYSGLDRYDANGNEYTYTVSEAQVSGYAAPEYDTNNPYNITNRITQGTVEVSGTKTWIDGNVAHVSANEVSLTLARSANGKSEVVSVLPAWDGNTYTFSDLPKYNEDGYEYNYIVRESNVVNGKVTIDGREFAVTQTGNDITNTIVDPADVTVSGTKTWVDGGLTHDNASEITLTLTRTANGATETVEAAPVWSGNTYTYSGLDKYDADGYEYTYAVSEAQVSGYDEPEYDINNPYNITNRIAQDTVEVSGTKTWIAPEGTVHPTITINLLRDGVVYKEVQLKDGETSYLFKDLPKYDLTDGHAYSYAVEEVPVAGYTSEQNGTDFTNTIAQQTVTVGGQKIWQNVEGVTLPETITVELFRDGEPTGITTTSAADWTYKFENLPRYAVRDITDESDAKEGLDVVRMFIELISGDENEFDGHEYVYSVEEVEVEGFTAYYDQKTDENGNVTINITNVPEGTLIPIKGQKLWFDASDVATHQSITIELWQKSKESDNLYSNERIDSIKLPIQLEDGSYSWEYDFGWFDKFDENGEPYHYYVKEAEVPAGYISVVSGYNVHNVQMALYEMGHITVTKDVEGTPASTTEFDFTLVVKATERISGVLDKAQQSLQTQLATMKQQADERLKAAKANLDGDEETKGAKQLFVESSFLTNTSASAYQFYMVDSGTHANLAVTTGSALYVEHVDMNLTPKTDLTDEEESFFDNAMAAIIQIIDRLADEFLNRAAAESEALTIADVDADQMDRPGANVMLTEIAQNVEVTSGSALAFEAGKLNGMFDAMVEHKQALVEYDNVMDAVADFTDGITTASAIVLIVNGDIENPIELDPESGKLNEEGLVEFEVKVTENRGGKATIAEKVFFDPETKEYHIPFTLLEDGTIDFSLQATTGSAVQYYIVESDTVKTDKNYVDTFIYNGEDLETDLAIEGTLRTDWNTITSGSSIGYIFKNLYEEDTPPGGGFTPEPPKKPEPPKPPEEIIDDPEVPLDEPPVVVPGEEIPEPEVPLGDAPRTGDTNNAVPFMALMLFAMAGLAVTRRRFN